MSTDTTEAPASTGPSPSSAGLSLRSLDPRGSIHRNLSPAQLYEHALERDEGRMVDRGGFATVTAPCTGRSPNDKFIVREESTADDIAWGSVNRPISEEHFRALRALVVERLESRDALFVRDARAGDHPEHGLDVRVVTENAWHALFAYNMFLRLDDEELKDFEPGFTVLHAPSVKADPDQHGTNSGTFVVVNYGAREVLIGGTHYAGEIKKSIFSVLNLELPRNGVLPMHCSANVGDDGDVALFFGLSGTGKTTLSADPDRGLIGDDEHGWAADGVFNFEGGCYAKVIRLSPEGEPEIYAATQRFGTILENVILDEDRSIAFDDGQITENTRASYPIHYIPNAVIPGRGGHPRHVIFLTADAFGVLPPISRLSPEQAMYHFLSGYTAKVAGTERGVTEPKATFSACFGAPFLPMNPSVYAEMLGERLREHGARVWLVNTGWTGGGFGVGARMELGYTRAMVRAALAGALDEVATSPDPVFGIHVPGSVPGVPSDVLEPRNTWEDGSAYDAAAEKLARMFRDNFSQFEAEVPEEVRTAGP